MTICDKYLLYQTALLSLFLYVICFRAIIHSKPQGNNRLMFHTANLCACVHECLSRSTKKAYGLHNEIGAIIFLLQNIKKIIKPITKIGDLKTDSLLQILHGLNCHIHCRH